MKRPMQPTVNCEPDNMSNYDLTAYLNDKKELINNELDKIFRDLPNSSHIVKAMKYSLMAGGKRIRPILRRQCRVLPKLRFRCGLLKMHQNRFHCCG